LNRSSCLDGLRYEDASNFADKNSGFCHLTDALSYAVIGLFPIPIGYIVPRRWFKSRHAPLEKKWTQQLKSAGRSTIDYPDVNNDEYSVRHFRFYSRASHDRDRHCPDLIGCFSGHYAGCGVTNVSSNRLE